MKYHYSKTLIDKNFNQAIDLAKEELQKEGFGILTEIDVRQTLKNKLDVDFKKYTILGACNPGFAYKALQAEDKIGVFLPCNVIVEEHDNGEIEVSAVNPIASMSTVENPSLADIAKEVDNKLQKVIASIK